MAEVQTVRIQNAKYMANPVSSLSYFGEKVNRKNLDPIVIIGGDFNTIDPSTIDKLTDAE